MKLFALVLLLVALVALPAVAQNPEIDGIIAQGKVFQSVAGIDTLHSSLTRTIGAGGQLASKWRGPIPIWRPRNTGAMEIERYSLPNAYYVYARKPFYYKAMWAVQGVTASSKFATGDSSGTVSTYIDTIPRVSWSAREIFPCWTVVYGPVQQLRFDPTAADTVYVKPIVLKH